MYINLITKLPIKSAENGRGYNYSVGLMGNK